MTQRERYGLTFSKVTISNAETSNQCIRQTLGIYSGLQIINYLDVFDCQALIKEMENAQNGRYFEELFSADASGNDSIAISPPNIIINDYCIIPLTNMRELLQEWIDFCSSK